MDMKLRHWLAAFAAMVVAQAVVHALTPPSASDGPIKLLTCIVTPEGILEAEVDNQTEDSMNCTIRCNYELGDRMFSNTFNVTIPGRFHGRVGRFDTSNARAGNYSGDLGNCEKISR
jgi:hypothetical protein